MKIKKKIIAIYAASALTLLSACGGKSADLSDNSTQPPANQTEKNETSDVTTAVKASDESGKNPLFVNGLLQIQSDGKYGYIDKTGSWVIEPQFDLAGSFSDYGVAAVKLGDSYGVIDKQGNYVVNPKFDKIGSFAKNGLALVKVDGKYGYINETGKIVIKPQFDNAYNFAKNGLARVEVDKKYGYINETGKIVIKPQFDEAYVFSENGLACVEVNGKYGYINEKGEFVIEPQFSEIFDNPYEISGMSGMFSSEWAGVKVGDSWGIIDETGTFKINPKYEELLVYSDGFSLLFDYYNVSIIDLDENVIFTFSDTREDTYLYIYFEELFKCMDFLDYSSYDYLDELDY